MGSLASARRSSGGLRPDRRRFLAGLGAGAALLVAPTGRGLEAASALPVYQDIWDADQAERGVPALRPRQPADPARGYVRVAEVASDGAAHRLFEEVRIPEAKRLTYDLVKRLFDNYRLDQTKPEDDTPEEAREILGLLDGVTDSAPLGIAKAHLEREQGLRYSRDAWQELIFDLWFRPFDDGRNLDLSGFEHVMVGEQRQGTVNGYHFWYKYYLDDWGLLGRPDAIDFEGLRYDGPNRPDGRLAALGTQVPEIVTLAWRWHAYDAASSGTRPLYKPVGSFFVGCSIEGLMALGTVRFFERTSGEAVINGARLRIELSRSPDGRSLRTCFPRFLGLA
ncbi:MAG: hypothetical protein ACREH6_07850 [Geminicoccaceae bacterium]